MAIKAATKICKGPVIKKVQMNAHKVDTIAIESKSFMLKSSTFSTNSVALL